MVIDEKNKVKYIQRIMLARMRILSRNGLFGLILMHARFALDDSVETAATDGERIFFAPSFLDTITDDELVFVLLHEIGHIILRHATRRGDRNNCIFNIAADIVVNSNILYSSGGDVDCITLAKYGETMHTAPDGAEGYKYTTEEVFEMLLDEGNITQLDMDSIDDHSRWGTSNTEGLEEIWQMHIRNAYEASKGRQGVLADALKRSIEDSFKPKTDWRTVLNDFIQEETVDYSFQPPDRRFDSSPFYLPDFNDRDAVVRDVLFFIDTSFSMNDREVSYAYSEIRSAIEQFNSKLEGWLGFFDTVVYPPVKFADYNDYKNIKPIGGGGTDFDVIFDYITNEMSGMDIACIIILTDGVANYPDEGKANGIPVLWMINNERTMPPWGRVIRISSLSS